MKIGDTRDIEPLAASIMSSSNNRFSSFYNFVPKWNGIGLCFERSMALSSICKCNLKFCENLLDTLALAAYSAVELDAERSGISSAI